MKPVIEPTTGRRVLLFVPPSANLGGPAINSLKAPFDAGIAYVWGSDSWVMNRINCSYADHNGVAHNYTSVALYDRPQDDSDGHDLADKIGAYAVWMPYQYEAAMRATAPKRPPEVEMVKLSDNGILTAAGEQRVREGNFQAPEGGTDPEGFVLADDRFDAVANLPAGVVVAQETAVQDGPTGAEVVIEPQSADVPCMAGETQPQAETHTDDAGITSAGTVPTGDTHSEVEHEQHDAAWTAEPLPGADGGVLEGADRTTDGTIGQP